MLTRLLLIQKINATGTMETFQADSGIFNWSFESRRTHLPADPEYFPVHVGAGCRIQLNEQGAETRIRLEEGEILFSDDYAVPAGTVIVLLFPRLFIPGDIVFKDKPYIPVREAGNVTIAPPGQIDIFYHDPEKRCAVVFHIHENSCFGFGCVASKVGNTDFLAWVKKLKIEINREKAVQEVWLQNHDVMRLLKINDRTLMRRRKNGMIPFSGTRGSYLYKKSDIERILR